MRSCMLQQVKTAVAESSTIKNQHRPAQAFMTAVDCFFPPPTTHRLHELLPVGVPHFYHGGGADLGADLPDLDEFGFRVLRLFVDAVGHVVHHGAVSVCA